MIILDSPDVRPADQVCIRPKEACSPLACSLRIIFFKLDTVACASNKGLTRLLSTVRTGVSERIGFSCKKRGSLNCVSCGAMFFFYKHFFRPVSQVSQNNCNNSRSPSLSTSISFSWAYSTKWLDWPQTGPLNTESKTTADMVTIALWKKDILIFYPCNTAVKLQQAAYQEYFYLISLFTIYLIKIQ